MFCFEKPNNWSELPLYKKLSYYKLILNENYAIYVDKLEVKIVVKNILKDEIKVANVIRILKDDKDFSEMDKNSNHVLKSTHGSGWNIIDLKNTDTNRILSMLKYWNRTYDIYNEPHYSYVKPRFFIEEKLHDVFGGDYLSTFMFRCTHGKVFTFSISKNKKINNFDNDGNPTKKLEHDFFIDDNLREKMKCFAEILSKPFEFVRIDFFIDNNKDIYFSEFTFTPLACDKYYSDELELKLGKLWT